MQASLPFAEVVLTPTYIPDRPVLFPALLPGIPPLERGWAERYGGQPAYEQYTASTNLLLPWPPRDKFP